MGEIYTEPYDKLSDKTIDIAQALQSLQEELEAIDWYNQRIVTCGNSDLKRILGHNRDEEISHACLLVGWLKLYMGGWDEQLADYVTNGDIATIGADKDAEGHYGAGYNEDLNIGKL